MAAINDPLNNMLDEAFAILEQRLNDESSTRLECRVNDFVLFSLNLERDEAIEANEVNLWVRGEYEPEQPEIGKTWEGNEDWKSLERRQIGEGFDLPGGFRLYLASSSMKENPRVNLEGRVKRWVEGHNARAQR